MKKILLVGILMVSCLLSAQNIEPKYEVVNHMVKATFFHDNGQIKEQGFYLDGKLHGKWVSYNENGVKQAMGEYKKGVKVGKWFFWGENYLSEVDYNNSKVAEVKKWTKQALAQN
ncbi:toxin-antitoxin system YwqK family antitoxin [Flavobacterium sp.]|uniref:toxin-antitoxin system YwqK family antitoxin n=1 Tax=Flavobacterium sp. TaxID=239 RepID=UPI003528E69A